MASAVDDMDGPATAERYLLQVRESRMNKDDKLTFVNASLLKRATNQLDPVVRRILSNFETSFMSPSQLVRTYLSKFTISDAIWSIDSSRRVKYCLALIGSVKILPGTKQAFASDCSDRKMSSYLITVNKLILSSSACSSS